jgi:TorA maturation chaperone TorD
MSADREQRVRFEERIGDEDQQRADLYGVLATLFAGPPNADLLLALKVQSQQEDAPITPLERAWRSLCEAADPAAQEACRQEYSACFQGIGKPPVFLYISYYASGFLHEKPLANIRQHLAQLGLSRKEGVSETEDHISSLCEVMRYLIMVEDLSIGDMNSQKQFFQAHLASWFEPLCDALTACEHAHFYSCVGEL